MSLVLHLVVLEERVRLETCLHRLVVERVGGRVWHVLNQLFSLIRFVELGLLGIHC